MGAGRPSRPLGDRTQGENPTMSLYRVHARNGATIWVYNFSIGGRRYNRRLGKVTQAQAEAMYAELKVLARERRAQDQVTALEQRLALTMRLEEFAAAEFFPFRERQKR
jgi:hypothetical protein